MDAQYNDIIDLPHHVSATRPQMSMIERAAQFSPFAALTGYDAAIKETGRLTDEKTELDEESLKDLDMRFQLLLDKLDDKPEVTITYFVPDELKSGGEYVVLTDTIKKVEVFERLLITMNGTKIPMNDVLSLESDLFSVLY